jgi:hypothetical protein
MRYIKHTIAYTPKYPMDLDLMRAHVIVPEELLSEVDDLVGPRRKSEFFVDAARERVAREKLLKAARKLGGSLAHADIPGWETNESSSEWVRSIRQENDDRGSASR